MKLTILFYALCSVSKVIGAAGFLVVPNDLPNNEGNASGWPFTFSDMGITARHYQQLYGSSQFASLGVNGAYITELRFREDMLISQVAHDLLDNVQIKLSITSQSPSSLSPIFSENFGPLQSTVYGPSPLVINTLSGWTTISLSEPFLYVPTAGNLLLDIMTLDNSPFPLANRRLDAEDTPSDAVSSVVANEANAASGLLTTAGLVTGFAFQPVPEPSTWTLMGVAFCGIWCLSRRRKSTTTTKQ